MKESHTGTSGAKPSQWQRTQYSNLIRYIPSGTYFARARVGGKLIRKSLNTDVLSVAKLRVADFVKEEREAAASSDSGSRGLMTFGDCVKLFLEQTEASTLLKPKSKKYRADAVDSIRKSWPGIDSRDVRQISMAQCETWAAKLSGGYSPSRYNGILGVFRAVFEVAIQSGALFRNPAQKVKRARVMLPHLDLPDAGQFEKFVKEIETANGRDSKKCADMVRFLAYGGFRVSEARNITWNDCDFKKEEIMVRGDLETGTKNWSVRRVPMIPEMREFLGRLREKYPAEKTAPVLPVKECLQAMTRAAKEIGMTRITHHHLRHLFATRCIESGVDIPTVSRWLGHKDGGALAMRVYGHLRQQHSVAMAKRVFFSKNKEPNVIELPKEAVA
jgi:integrase